MVEELDLEDWFGFVVGDARPLQGEGAEGALRYPVNAMIDGRVFEQMSLDVNGVDPRDARPIELVVVQRNPFEFVGEPSLEIPMVTPGQPELVEPPADWGRPWIGFITDYALPWNTLDAAFVALTQFWDPVLTGTAADSDGVWQRDLWRWK